MIKKKNMIFLIINLIFLTIYNIISYNINKLKKGLLILFFGEMLDHRLLWSSVPLWKGQDVRGVLTKNILSEGMKAKDISNKYKVSRNIVDYFIRKECLLIPNNKDK